MCTGVRGVVRGMKSVLEGPQETASGYFWGLRLEKEPVEKKATCSFYFILFDFFFLVVNLLLLQFKVF